jgi:CheY-like chemotaxis protein
MVMAYALVTACAGGVGFVLALMAGASLWWALGAYLATGFIAGFGVVVWHGILGRTGPEAVAPQTVTPASEGFRILAVDDDDYIRELLPKIAARVGCPEMVLTSSGDRAMAMVLEAPKPFDCLLLDITMPGIDGIDLCARLRQLPAYQHTPIIMLTAMTDIDHLSRAFRAGASDFTAKPFDVIELGARLQAARQQAAARRSAAFAPVRRIATLPAMIEPEALQTYLTRLSGSALSGAYVMAVLVTPETGPALTATARALDLLLSEAGAMMAYAGSGAFVLTGSGAQLPDASALQDRLTCATASLVTEAVTLHVGQALRPSRTREGRAGAAFDRALCLARDAAGASQTAPALQPADRRA